ncbi:hypothetical protein WJX81_003419 [Elliptochloris bilobata]|uniref:alpha-1,2-Mannosidase n=1 Tax=Elliptochloris bilobata TaxID=381761 RepID=A0AAW1S9Q6_9CHLO
MILRHRSLWAVICIFGFLGGYAFFLQSRLPGEDTLPGLSRRHGFRQNLDQQVLAAAAEELELLRRTQSLASEVAAVAKELQGRLQRAGADSGLGSGSGAGLAGTDKAKARGGLGSGGAHGGEQGPPIDTSTVEGKRAAVVAAARHAWRGYEAYAMGSDELQPLTRHGKDSFGGLGATVVDSLDTLWMMGLKEEFARARNWVANELSFNRSYDASVFETAIRVLGGMLTAHELSNDAIFLTRAEELGDILLLAYDTPTGIPYQTVNLRTRTARNPSWTQRSSILSELGTQQLEFMALSDKTGRAVFADKVEKVVQTLSDKFPNQALLPLFISPVTGRGTTDAVSLGAMGDSYYEYLLKVWIFKGKRAEDELYRAMWERAMDEMLDRLVYKNEASGLTYVAEIRNNRMVRHKMDHLACFVAGMLALGAHAGAVAGHKAAEFLEVAEELGETCWQMYDQMPTGLAPEWVEFREAGMVAGDGAHHNLLRPEALEAMFVLWRVTQKPKYPDCAWAMFQAFERHCKVADGYTGLRDVTVDPPARDNTMQSFWLAETLKYAWLIFSPRNVFDLDQYVLNTEAHPLRVLTRPLPRAGAKDRADNPREACFAAAGGISGTVHYP